MSKPLTAVPAKRARGISRTPAEAHENWNELVRPHTGPLRQFLRKRVADEAVDDVMQDVLLTTWSSWPDGVAAHFPGLLYRVARFKVLDWFRSHSRQVQRETTLPDEDIANHGDAFDQVNDRMLIRAIVGRLSPQQQEVIHLYYSEGLTLAEIAERLERGLSTVKYHFYRAHEDITRLWQEEVQ